jgi:hypothetical protein
MVNLQGISFSSLGFTNFKIKNEVLHAFFLTRLFSSYYQY